MDTTSTFPVVNINEDNKSPVKLSDAALRQVFIRHYQILGSYNYERQQANAYCYSMIPAIKELYNDDPEQTKEALQRHMEFFNTTCAMVPFIQGITCAMEEQNANAKDGSFDTNSINSVKASLMGPLAGIGDSFFWGTFRVLAVGIGAPMAVAGNILGPIFYFLINIIPSTLTRVFGFKVGYKRGQEFLATMSKEGTLQKATQAAKMIGLVVIGAMIALMINIKTVAVFSLAGTEVNLQNIFDQILPKLLPAAFTAISYWLLKKNVNSLWIMLGLILAGIIGKAIGFF